jgi:hypothetical protein
MTMPIPQVNDRIKEAPAVMLRAVFAGVGQLLLAADKVRARAAGTGWPYDRTAPQGQARAQSRWHTLDDGRMGTVPLARERASTHGYPAQRPSPGGLGSAAAGPAAVATAPPAAQAQPFAHAESATQAEDAVRGEPAGQAGPGVRGEPSADAPPLAGYDALSLPSLRARLRGFDAPTLRALLAYETAHAHRDDVITLFERRLEKITAE